MASNPKYQYFSLEEYLGIEAASDRRWEYWDGEVVCMSGGTRQHAIISGNVHYRLAQALDGSPCRAFTADTAIASPAHPTYLYPDASAACGDLEFRPYLLTSGVSLDLLVNPVLIIEVESPSSARHDQGRKFEAYKAIPTFREYLLIEQKSRRITQWRKIGGEWISATIATGVIPLGSLECELKVADIYDGVDL